MAIWLGLDYGARRIGVAVSDASGTLATALGTHRTPDDGSFFAWIGRLIDERGATGIVLGLPIEEAGCEGEAAARVRAFARRLAEATGLQVALVDERYSSREAAAWLAQGGRRHRPRGTVDAVAAEIILQQFLDRQRPGTEEES